LPLIADMQREERVRRRPQPLPPSVGQGEGRAVRQEEVRPAAGRSAAAEEGLPQAHL